MSCYSFTVPKIFPLPDRGKGVTEMFQVLIKVGLFHPVITRTHMRACACAVSFSSSRRRNVHRKLHP